MSGLGDESDFLLSISISIKNKHPKEAKMAELRVKVTGIEFRNPVLTAAGPNVRNGEMMLKAFEGGAGGVVAKTVSVRPARDTRPTIRKTVCRGLVNCETWSELPFEAMLEEYRKVKDAGIPLIVSIGYTPKDMRQLGPIIEREVEPDAIEFSTHYSGRSVEPLVEVAKALRESVNLPIWMKISPNLPDIEELAVKASPFVDAFVAINSYGPVLDFDVETGEPILGSEYGQGWLSGQAILPIALRIVHQVTSVQAKPVIGVGGIERGKDAIKFFMVGASAVQICSAAIRYGHSIYGKVAKEIEKWLDEHGFSSVDEVRGLFKEKLKSRKKFDGIPVMHIEESKCTGCKLCVRACVHSALYMDGDVAKVIPENCIGCGYCQDMCNFGAMWLVER